MTAAATTSRGLGPARRGGGTPDRARTTPLRPGQRARRRREALTGYALLFPSLIGVGGFLLVPVVLVILISVSQWNLLTDPSFVGLENYAFLMGSDAFWNSLRVTAYFSVMAIPTAIAIGLLLAIGINRGLPGTNALRVLYVLPWVCAPLALGVVWRWLFDPSTGAVNAILGQRIEWMSNPSLALPAVAFVYIWSSVGYISLFFLAGLQQIPTSVYEAARIDGAGPVRMLFSITLPLLRPTTFFVTVTSVIASFQVFDLVYGLTGAARGYPGGSTSVIAAAIYQEAFVALRLGRAAAMAVILLIVLVVITLAQQRYFAKRITYDMSAS
ncbi:carbohydrate ABC transporter permease [Bogoriella caseilytica]|uniref:Carbohydrate ABC transporter membrane protein 1 (CUT1 family) n=1 Tax=Bogoriella caseilytica TaxID=56055 RepID=A0A3N2BC64_9MICO|nr:sugar ABC transporter permease [Bogoriella caseilytica]ROR72851.1 carbohydrate ABC transporter membrane protein 1 (CUT1 family) [Bogoriella caseilytica]